MNDPIPRLALLALAIAFAVSPLLSNGFGGFSAESFPVQVDRWPAQPVGWAFSIWGLIYLALVLSAAWSVLRPAEMPGWGTVSWPLGLSLFLGIFWVEAAMRSPLLATAMILPMTALALTAMFKLRSGRREWAAVGLYAGWLTAASGVAVSVVLTGYGILPPRVAAIALIVAVLVLAVAVAARHPRVLSYRAGVIWALFGVIVANLQAGDWLITALAGIGIALLFLLNPLLSRSKTPAA